MGILESAIIGLMTLVSAVFAGGEFETINAGVTMDVAVVASGSAVSLAVSLSASFRAFRSFVVVGG